MAARIEQAAAGIIERQAETEAQALAHLGDALLDLLGGEQVEAAELIVRPEIAPGRTLGTALPARGRVHRRRSATFVGRMGRAWEKNPSPSYHRIPRPR